MTVVDLHLPIRADPVSLRAVLRSAARSVLYRILAVREVGILTILALISYILVGFYIRYDLHFFINDQLNRTADALYVTESRDPHLAAIGFFWPPIPQLIQIPLMPILVPLGKTIMAGPIATAFSVAGTIPILSRIGRFVGLGRPTTFLFLLAFAFNPITLFYSSIGMSEGVFFFTGSWALYGFLRYIRTHAVADMWIFGWGLAACVLTRLEGPLFALVLGVAATFRWRCLISLSALRQAAWTTLLIGTPAAASFGLWMIAQWLILGNPIYFINLQGGAGAGFGAAAAAAGGAGGTAGGAGTVPTVVQWPNLPPLSKEPWASFPWAGWHIVVFGAVLILVAATIVVAPWWNRTRGSVGIVLAMASFMAFQINAVGFAKTGFGNPRYFVVAVPFSIIGAMWLASAGRKILSPLWNVGLVGVCAFNWYTGTRYSSNGLNTRVEHECTFFQDGVAKLLPSWGTGDHPDTNAYCSPFGDPLTAYQEAAAYLDKVMTPSDRVFTDNSSVFQPDLFTLHPNQYIVRNDRDFAKIADDPLSGEITYIITHGTSATSLPLQDIAALNVGGVDVGEQIIYNDPSDWKIVGAWESSPGIWVQVYHLNLPASSHGA